MFNGISYSDALKMDEDEILEANAALDIITDAISKTGKKGGE